MENAYELYRRGQELLAHGDYAAAAIPLRRARDLHPDKSSVREELGRALFHSGRYREAAEEFSAVVQTSPTNDYALFCLGRSLQQLGRHQEACGPLAIAACMCPERTEYRRYRDQARARAGRSAVRRGGGEGGG